MADDDQKGPEPPRVIDVHLHLFNTKLQGTDGIPKYVSQDATVEAAGAGGRVAQGDVRQRLAVLVDRSR